MRPAYLIGLSGIVLGLVSLALINVTALPIDASLWLPVALLLKLLQGVPIMGLFVSVDTLLQQSVADRYRGRIFGAYGAISALTMLGGQAAASLLGDRVGLVPVLNWMGNHVPAGRRVRAGAATRAGAVRARAGCRTAELLKPLNC